MPPSALPRPGDIVAGKYRIDSVVGEGGMGVVLGATDTSLGRAVAIKFLSPARAANEAASARFGREARAAASIQSEHVVRVHEVGTLPDGAPFIVMEHLRGSDLATVVEQRGGLPIDYTCDLVLQACEALGDAHARGIVHRDLKPQNLFLTVKADGAACLKVLDFGISKAAEDEASPKLTSTDMVMGTPLYMSPEQVRSLKNVDARADIWALGAILHELLTASPPFDGPTASALHAAIAMDPPPPLRTLRPDAPAALEAIILRCLEKDPARRFQDVASLADALASYATPLGRTSAGRVIRALPQSAPVIISSAPPAIATQGNASTISAWHNTPAPAPVVAPKSSSLRVVVGILAAALLFMIGGVGLAVFFLVFRNHSVTVSSNDPEPATVTVDIPPIDVPPIGIPSLEAPPADGAPDPAQSAPRDAGASDGELRSPFAKERPSSSRAAKDAGPVAETPDQWRAHRAQQMAPLCEGQQLRMRTAPNDDLREVAARSAMGSCQGPASVRCERETCREACEILKDQNCLQQLRNNDQWSPTKY